MNNYLKGLGDIFGSFGLIFQPGIRRFIIIPLFINISLFSAAIYLLSQQMNQWIESLLPDWLSWLEWLLWPLFMATALLFVFYTFSLVANLIAAPFNSLLSARVEQHLTGVPLENISEEKWWAMAARSIAAEIHKMFYFIKWLIPLIILTLIPGLNLAAPLAWFIFTAWSFSLEYMDYPLANRGLLFKEIRQYNRLLRMRSLGLGSGIFIITSIPVLNFLAMPLAVISATRLTTAVKASPEK
ncbi:MAG: sulfate transporter CysZ [Gammaproteobacteria bacterium]|nr:sulfate transporter CysZ [Gammaproteobacteria bacterium]